MRTLRTRSRSPFKRTSATPGMVKNCGAKSTSTRSANASRDKLSLDTVNDTTASASLSALIIDTRSTSSGNSRCTRATDSRVSFAASSRLTPGRNSTTIRALFSSLWARIDFTPLTLATAPSSLLVTSVSTVSGEPPGKDADTVIRGLSTSGSSRTSTPAIAAIPAIIMSKLSTTIKTGRRIAIDGKSSIIGCCFIITPWLAALH